MRDRPLLLLCLDGCGPGYLEAAETPTLDYLGRAGERWLAQAAVPTVTNVNLASLLTASPPSAHGITGNSWFPAPGAELAYMEEQEQLRAPSVFRRVRERGGTTALLTAKHKLQHLFARDVTWACSVEEPAGWALAAAGPPPDIYSAAANPWLLRAAMGLVGRERPDLLVLATTDYIPHLCAPPDPIAREQFNTLDRLLGELLGIAPDVAVIVTADHGMNGKTRFVPLGRALDRAARMVPIIRDRYTAHHHNLGGSVYVCLESAGDQAVEDARCRLEELPGVESVYTAARAAAAFSLPVDRIGDLLVFADRDTVFADGGEAAPAGNLRSHGSLHEREVPVITCGVSIGRCAETWQLLGAALGVPAAV